MGKKKNLSLQKGTGQSFDFGDWSGRNANRLLILILAWGAFWSLLMFDPKPFVGGDNAAYVSLSKSLVQGKGMTEIWTPDSRPHTQYPFGFPLLLTPVSLLKLPYAWYKLIPWISGLLSLLVLAFILKDGQYHLLPVLLLALNPYFLEYTHWVLSELPFTLFVLLSFLFLKKWEGGGKPLWLGLAMAVAVFANHIRSAGLALYLGIFLYLLFRKKYRESVIFLAGCILLTVPWTLRNRHFGTSGGYLEQFLMRDPYQPELGYLGLPGLLQRLMSNVRIYFATVMSRMVFPALDHWKLSGAAPVITLAAVFPALVALIARLVKKAESYDWFALIYLGLTLLWPEAWSDARFLLPLLPFLLLYLTQAYGYIIKSLFKKNWLRPAAALSLLLIVSNISAGGQMISHNIGANKSYFQDKYSGYDPAWRSFFTAAEWVNNHTPSGSVVVSRKPTLFFLGSGRKSYCYPFTADRDSLLGSIDRADYVMVEPVSGTGQRFLIPAVQSLIDKKYKIVYAGGDPPTYVLQVMKEVKNAR